MTTAHCWRTLLFLIITLCLPASLLFAQEPCGPGRSRAAPGKLYERIATSKMICVGVRNALPPFSSKDKETGRFEGFDVSLAQIIRDRVVEQAGQDIKLIWVGFDRPGQVIDAIKSGRLDFAVAAVTRTRKRDMEDVDFSVDYFLDRQEVLVDKSTFKGLEGMEIAVLQGSTAQAKWALRHPEVKLSPCKSHAHCVEMLKTGKVQGYAGDRAIILWQVLQAGMGDRFQLSGLPEFGDFEDAFWMEPYAVLLPQDQSRLRDLINLAFEVAWSEDLIDMLFHLHFGDKSQFKGRISYDLPYIPSSYIPSQLPSELEGMRSNTP